MPNVQILALKNTLPRVGSKTLLDQFIADNGRMPFGPYLTSEREYDLPAVIMARATEWEVELDFTWTASATASGVTDSVTAHIRGTEPLESGIEKQGYTGYTGIDGSDPFVNPDPPVTGVNEETLAHEDFRLQFGSFNDADFTDREFTTQTDSDPPIDNSASLRFGHETLSPISVFGGSYNATGFLFTFSAGHIGPAPGGMGRVISDGAGYEEQIGYPSISTDPDIFPSAVLCGSITIVWYHSSGGTEFATCPVYTLDMSIMSAGAGVSISRNVSFSATMTQVAGLRYGDTYLPSGEKA